MKKFLILLLIIASLCVGCDAEKSEKTTTEPSTEPIYTDRLPQGLEGQWASASVDERGYSESITFNADGTLLVESLQNGVVQNSIFGTFYVKGNQIVFRISDGTTPYDDYFDYVIDGRELWLYDDDSPAHYLRTS